jgi:hypothetical protein
MHQEEQINPEHQLHTDGDPTHLHDFREVAGTPVFSADNERVGAVERVMTLSDTTGERFLIVNPGARRRIIGADRLYVPESSVQASEQDRLILESPLSALPVRDWSESPTGVGRG